MIDRLTHAEGRSERGLVVLNVCIILGSLVVSIAFAGFINCGSMIGRLTKERREE